MIVQHNLDLQREWYGETLGDRVRRLVVAFNVSQSQLAGVLGVSAPMLSQLMSGYRAKIGNPSVLGRMIMLERRVLTPDVAAGAPEALRRALDDVRAAKPTVGCGSSPVGDGADETAVLSLLHRIADRRELARAADALYTNFPTLTALLLRASKPLDKA